MTTVLDTAFATYAASIERKWPTDRNKTIGASEISRCARALWYRKHADGQRDPKNIDNWGRKGAGNDI